MSKTITHIWCFERQLTKRVLSDFLAQDCADKTLLWSLTPKLPKCRGWCAVKAVHRIAMSVFPAAFRAQPLLPAPADAGNVRVILARQSPTGSTFQERGADVGWVKELSSVFVQFCRGQAHPQKCISMLYVNQMHNCCANEQSILGR